MSVVTVSAGLIGSEYHGAESSLKLRIYCRKTFTTTDLEPIVKSGVGAANFYKEVNCTVVSGVINHDTFTIDSTTNGVPNDSHYVFALFTNEGEGRGIVHKHIKVPPTPTPTTFGDLAIYNDLPVEELSVTAYNAIINYINTIIAGLTNMATKATTSVFGATRMSYVPATSMTPIAVENNDPIIRSTRRTFLLESYGYTPSGLTTALAVIGSNDADLLLTSNLVISNGLSYVVPANVRLVFAANGTLGVTNGSSLTIRSMVPPATPRQIFVTDATGVVVLDSNATGGEIWLDWWAAPGGVGDSSHAIDQIQTSQSLGNPRVRAGRGTWLFSQWDLPLIGQIEGAGMWDGNGTRTGTVFEPFNPAATTYMIKASEAFRGITLRNLTIYLGTALNINAVVLEGTTPNSAKAAFLMSRCSILSYGVGAADRFRIHTLDPAQWECTNIAITDNLFVATGGKVITIDTENSSLNIERNEFIVGAATTVIYLNPTGYTNISHNQFGGVNASDLTSNNATRTTALVAQGNLVSGSPLLNLTSGVFEEADIGRKITIGAFSSYITDLVLVAGRASRAVLMSNSSINATNQNVTVDDIVTNPARAHCAIHIAGAHTSININNNVDEGFEYFIINEGFQLECPMNLRGNFVQGRIRVNGSCNIVSVGNNYKSQTFIEGDPNALIRLQSIDYVSNASINLHGGSPTIVLAKAQLWNARNGNISVMEDKGFPETKYEETHELPINIFDRALNYIATLIPATQALLTVASAKLTGSGAAQMLIRWGRLHPTTKRFDYGYWLGYHYNSGKTVFQSNQNPVIKGYAFDGPLWTPAVNITPASESAFTSDQNDYQPANIAGAYIVGSNAWRNLTGWAAKPADPGVLDFDLADAYNDPKGKLIELQYSGSTGITLKHNSGSSIAANRFFCDWGTDINLTDGDRVLLRCLAAGGGWAVSRLTRSEKVLTLAADKDFQSTGVTMTNTNISFQLGPGSYEVTAHVPSSNVAKSLQMDWAGGGATIGMFVGTWESTMSAATFVSAAGTAFSDNTKDTTTSTFSFKGCMTITAGGTFVLRGAQRTADASSTKMKGGTIVSIVPAKAV